MEITAWTRQNELISEAKQREWEERIVKDNSIRMLGIKDGSHREVGTCGLTSINWVHRTAEFSLFIAPEYQRQGYGREALMALLKYGFEVLNLYRIFGETMDGNPALKMFLDLGMKEEGRLRETYEKNGQRIGSTVVSMLRPEYQCAAWKR